MCFPGFFLPVSEDHFLKKILFICFEREGKGGRKTSMCKTMISCPLTGDLAGSPGMCPD